VLVMGLTFKENVPDIRNSKIHDTIVYLQGYGIKVLGCDPLVPADLARRYFGIETVTFEQAPQVDAILIGNKHNAFKSLTLAQFKTKMSAPVVVDIKNLFNRAEAKAAGFHYTTL